MKFLVIGYDGEDKQAPARREAVREEHLRQAAERFAQGEWLYAAAILSDEGAMIGSLIVCDYPSREALESQWLAREPYITGDVWRKTTIHRAQVPPFLLRP